MIIRAHQLEPGDIYIKQGVHYRVRNINGHINCSVDCRGHSGAISATIGVNSRERVSLVSKLIRKRKTTGKYRRNWVRLPVLDNDKTKTG